MNYLVDGHHDLGISGKQVFILLVARGLQFVLLQHDRVKADALVRVLVAPIPLTAGGLDGQVRLGHLELQEQKP